MTTHPSHDAAISNTLCSTNPTLWQRHGRGPGSQVPRTTPQPDPDARALAPMRVSYGEVSPDLHRRRPSQSLPSCARCTPVNPNADTGRTHVALHRADQKVIGQRVAEAPRVAARRTVRQTGASVGGAWQPLAGGHGDTGLPRRDARAAHASNVRGRVDAWWCTLREWTARACELGGHGCGVRCDQAEHKRPWPSPPLVVSWIADRRIRVFVRQLLEPARPPTLNGPRIRPSHPSGGTSTMRTQPTSRPQSLYDRFSRRTITPGRVPRGLGV